MNKPGFKPKINFREILDKVKKIKLSKLAKKNIVVFCAIALIGGAVYLNWALFRDDTPEIEAGAGLDNIGGDTAPVAEGEDAEAYFAVTEINRQRARDEAMEVLQNIVDSADTSEEAKIEAISGLTLIAAQIENEANIESLIESKGIDDCVAVLSESGADIVVKTDGLLPNEIVQIRDIVCSHADISPTDIKIIEK